MAKKKILLFCLHGVIGSRGGVGNILFSMGNKFVEFGYDVYVVICDNTSGEILYDINEKITLFNIAGSDYTKSLTLWQKLRRAMAGNQNDRHIYEESITDRYISGKLAPIIYEIKPDLGITFSTDATRILYHYIDVKFPTITTQHGDPEIILDKLTNYTLHALHRTDYIQVLLDSYIRKSSKKTTVPKTKFIRIPNPIPQYLPNWDNKQNIIVCISRVDGSKMQHLIIEAFSLLRDKYPDWKVEFWGDYSNNINYYKQCNSLIDKYELKERVLFCGETREVELQLQRAKIYITTSLHEGFPISLGEAMGAGLPAVGLKQCPAVNELIINGKNGFLCDNAPESIAAVLDKLMADEELLVRLGQNAHESMKQFAPDKVWNMWHKLVENIFSE